MRAVDKSQARGRKVCGMAAGERRPGEGETFQRKYAEFGKKPGENGRYNLIMLPKFPGGGSGHRPPSNRVSLPVPGTRAMTAGENWSGPFREKWTFPVGESNRKIRPRTAVTPFDAERNIRSIFGWWTNEQTSKQLWRTITASFLRVHISCSLHFSPRLSGSNS